MTAPKFTVEQGEHGPEYFEGESKLAFTNSSGTLQFTRGNGERREEVEAWIKHHTPKVDTEKIISSYGKSDGPTGEPASSVDEVPSEHNKEAVENVIVDQIATPESRIALPIICPIVGSSHLGDKDPAVIAWHFSNDRKAAEAKYANHRNLWPS